MTATHLLPDYRAALRCYLADDQETARAQGYMLGRWALDTGQGLSPVLAAHHVVLAEMLSDPQWDDDKILEAAAQLLTEATAPFEMAYRGFRQANDALRSLNRDLATEMDERSAAVTDGLRRLQIVDAERRRLLGHLVHAQEAERRRIAGDIHDDSIQVVTALAMRLGMLASKEADPALRDMVAEGERTAQQAIVRLRGLLFDLRPPELEHGGLLPTLVELRQRFRHQWDIDWVIDNHLTEEPSVALRIVLFRVAQEALTNARKHARAEHVQLRLENVDGGVLLTVTDDGVGFDPERRDTTPIGHLGLVSMRERVELASGWWKLRSAPGEGTTVEAWVPLDDPTTPEADSRDSDTSRERADEGRHDTRR